MIAFSRQWNYNSPCRKLMIKAGTFFPQLLVKMQENNSDTRYPSTGNQFRSFRFLYKWISQMKLSLQVAVGRYLCSRGRIFCLVVYLLSPVLLLDICEGAWSPQAVVVYVVFVLNWISWFTCLYTYLYIIYIFTQI